MREATIGRAAPTMPGAPDRAATDLAASLEAHRVELTACCYGMVGSAFEADDPVQETFIRHCRGIDRFDGRAAPRSWLNRVATSACFDMRNGSQRRARPMDLAGPLTADHFGLPCRLDA
jgi:RNA polymerase sigma-70 factor, ECF subfamily